VRGPEGRQNKYTQLYNEVSLSKKKKKKK